MLLRLATKPLCVHFGVADQKENENKNEKEEKQKEKQKERERGRRRNKKIRKNFQSRYQHGTLKKNCLHFFLLCLMFHPSDEHEFNLYPFNLPFS